MITTCVSGWPERQRRSLTQPRVARSATLGLRMFFGFFVRATPKACRLFDCSEKVVLTSPPSRSGYCHIPQTNSLRYIDYLHFE